MRDTCMDCMSGFQITDKAVLEAAPIGLIVTDRDNFTLVKVSEHEWALISPWAESRGRHAYVSNEEIDGAYAEDHVSTFYPLTVAKTAI